MRNFVQEGKVLTIEASETVAAGDFVRAGGLKGFAQNDAVTGQSVAVVTEGVFETDVAAAGNVAVGASVYATPGFAPTLTTAATDGAAEDPVSYERVGFATEAATALAGVATVNVKLV
jgi:predicted RecA/RadA family phage recombinase